MNKIPAAGKPAKLQDYILERRYNLLKKCVSIDPHSTTCDIGCGNGAQHASMLNIMDKIIAIDINQDFLQIVKYNTKEVSEKKIYPVRASAVQLPILSQTISLCVSFEVLEHVENDYEMLKEIHRILKPDGQLFMTVPNKWWIFETHGADLPLLPWNRVPGFSWLPKSLHDKWALARNYTQSGLYLMLDEVGFNVEKMGYVTAPMDVVKNEKLKRFLRRTLFSKDETAIPFKGTAIFVKACKRT